MKNKVKFLLVIILNVVVTINFGCGSREKKNLEISERIFVAFGDGANGKGELEQYLLIATQIDNNTWIYKNPDTNKTFQIKFLNSQNELLGALLTDNAYVVYDGHANFGIGPNFPNDTIEELSDFLNIGTRYNGINLQYLKNQRTPRTFPNLKVPGDKSEIPLTFTNYKVPTVQLLKFDSGYEGYNFELQSWGDEKYHYRVGGEMFLIAGPKPEYYKDLPQFGFKHKVCFMNACNSGIHYIETLNHGTLFYTKYLCSSFLATTKFVKGIIEGKSYDEIKRALNSSDTIMVDYYEF